MARNRDPKTVERLSRQATTNRCRDVAARCRPMQPVWLVSGEGYAYLRFGPSQGNFEQARVRNHERERGKREEDESAMSKRRFTNAGRSGLQEPGKPGRPFESQDDRNQQRQQNSGHS